MTSTKTTLCGCQKATSSLLDIQNSIQAPKLLETRDMIHCPNDVLMNGSITTACIGGVSEENVKMITKRMKEWHSL